MNDPVGWLREAGIATTTTTPGVASICEAVVGEPITGSWWGHPEGKRIWRALMTITESGEALECRLLGRVTWLHRDLWPAFATVVADKGYRAWARERVGEEARELLDLVEAEGEIPAKEAGERLGWGKSKLARLRRKLQVHLLVADREVHMPAGHHVLFLGKWSIDVAGEKPAVADAVATLVEACGTAENVLREFRGRGV